jgi:hypothetical protein
LKSSRRDNIWNKDKKSCEIKDSLGWTCYSLTAIGLLLEALMMFNKEPSDQALDGKTKRGKVYVLIEQ